MTGDSGEHTPEVEARLRLSLERLDRRLTEQEIAIVRSRLARQAATLRRIRTVPLGNGDEPASGFDPALPGRAEEPPS